MSDQEYEEKVERDITAWHLQNNFIPPQPPELLEYCIKAMHACNEGNDDRVIQLPGGVTVTAGQLVDDLRLNDMIAAEYSDDSDVSILGNAQKALSLLTEADDMASDLGGRGLLDYKKSSAMAKYILRVLMPLRELIEYVEKELT